MTLIITTDPLEHYEIEGELVTGTRRRCLEACGEIPKWVDSIVGAITKPDRFVSAMQAFNPGIDIAESHIEDSSVKVLSGLLTIGEKEYFPYIEMVTSGILVYQYPDDLVAIVLRDLDTLIVRIPQTNG